MDVVEEIGGLATDANDNPTSEATLESVDVDR
jgi:hypothetical protein